MNEQERGQRITDALQAMVDEAIGFRGRGIAVVVVESAFYSWQSGMRMVTDYQRLPNPDVNGDKGTNYIAIAWAKVAQMISMDIDSGLGNRPLLNGEEPYRGGVMLQIGATRYFAAFSGLTEDQDVKIAEVGLKVLTAGIA